MNDSFDTWKGSRPLLDGDHLAISDFEHGAVVHCYHGTTHDFTRFDPTIRGWSDGQFGAVNYFTTDSWDAASNYLEDGADLKNRLEQVTERLVDDIWADPESFDLDGEDLDENLVADTAQSLARAQVVGPTPRVLDLYVRLDNPFFLGGPKAWRIPNLPSMDDLDISVDPEDEEEWDMAWEDAYNERAEMLTDLFDKAADILGYDGTIEVPTKLFDDSYDGTSKDLETIILDHHVYLECLETGRLLSHALVGAVIQALGYDSIVLLEADKRFTSMSMNAGTTHIHLFGKPDGMVKSTDMAVFDEKDPDFC